MIDLRSSALPEVPCSRNWHDPEENEQAIDMIQACYGTDDDPVELLAMQSIGLGI